MVYLRLWSLSSCQFPWSTGRDRQLHSNISKHGFCPQHFSERFWFCWDQPVCVLPCLHFAMELNISIDQLQRSTYHDCPTPRVTIAQIPRVTVAQTHRVTLAQTPRFKTVQAPRVKVSQTPGVTITQTVHCLIPSSFMSSLLWLCPTTSYYPVGGPNLTAACFYLAQKLDKRYGAWSVVQFGGPLPKSPPMFVVNGLYLWIFGSEVTRRISCDPALL